MYCEPLYGFPSPFKKFLPFSKAIFNHKQYKIILLSRGQILRIPFTRYSLDSVALHSKRGLQKYLLHGFWKSSRSEAQSYTPDLNPKPCLEIHFIWASSWNHCCPFLFLAYKPRQAQNPMTLTARPSRKAMVSPASRASTTGSTSSNATRTRKSFEVFSVKGMLTTSWPQGEVKRGKRWKAGTSAVPTRKTEGTWQDFPAFLPAIVSPKADRRDRCATNTRTGLGQFRFYLRNYKSKWLGITRQPRRVCYPASQLWGNQPSGVSPWGRVGTGSPARGHQRPLPSRGVRAGQLLRPAHPPLLARGILPRHPGAGQPTPRRRGCEFRQTPFPLPPTSEASLWAGPTAPQGFFPSRGAQNGTPRRHHPALAEAAWPTRDKRLFPPTPPPPPEPTRGRRGPLTGLRPAPRPAPGLPR